MTVTLRIWLPRAIGAAFFVAYAWLTPAGPFWLDSPELSAAAHRLGSSHPTGFPLYALVAKAFGLLPIGEIAWRINLVSAASGAAALTWLARLMIEQDDKSSVAALAATFALGVCYLFARHATAAEVYAPTVALIALAALQFARVARGEGARAGLLLAVICGLGLALHTSFRLVGLPVLALLIWRYRRGQRWVLAAPLLALGVGAALYLYLPVRAAAGDISGVNWGDPATAGALYGHVTAASIRAAFDDQIFSPHLEVILQQSAVFGGQLSNYLGPVCLLLAAAGVVALCKRGAPGWQLALLGALVFGDAVYAVLINPMGLVDVQNGVPIAFALCALTGVGTAWFVRLLGRVAPYAGAVLVLMIGLPPLLASWEAIVISANSELPRRWAEAALAQTPPRGAALTQSDSLTASLLYLQEVEHARPDADALVRQHLLAPIHPVLGDGPGPMLLSALLGRPVPITWELGTDGLPTGWQLQVGVPLGKLGRNRLAYDPLTQEAKDQGVNDISVATNALRELFDDPAAVDPEALRLQAHVLTGLGRVAMMRRDLARGELLFDAALGFNPDSGEALVNRGVAASYRGDLHAALDYTERALLLEPQRIKALINAARYRLALGDPDGARRDLEHVLELEPGNRAAAKALADLPPR